MPYSNMIVDACKHHETHFLCRMKHSLPILNISYSLDQGGHYLRTISQSIKLISKTVIELAQQLTQAALFRRNFIQSPLLLFPNPTSGPLIIQSLIDVKEVQILNTVGKTVLRSYRKELDLTDLPQGPYITEVHLLNGEIHFCRIIKD